VFGDGRDWHGKSLLRAFKRRGIAPLLAPLNACGFSTETATGLAIPGLGDHRPDGAFVRFVPGGSFEEVTLYLGVLHALRELGVTVWNDARAIERCVDKSTTTFFLQREGLPTPRTFAGVNRTEAEQIAATLLAEGHKLVQKPLFGAQGKGLRLISKVSDLSAPEEVNGVYYLQEFIPPAQEQHQDWRLFVCAGKVVAAMIRHGSSWITNIKQGARAKAAIPSQALIDLALRSAACVGADYAGVDVIQAPDRRFLVLEVNSMPAWNGLQRVTRVPISDHLVDAFLDAALPSMRRKGQEGA
jgi:RimK family alpha-L-glutamate ligase